MGDQTNLTKTAETFLGSFGGLSILDTIIPGFSVVSNVLVNFLGVDISRLIPILAFLFALSKASDYFYYHFRYQALKWLTCSVMISSDLDAYYNVSRMLADRKGMGKWSSDLAALSNRRTDGSWVDPELEQADREAGGPKRRRPQGYEPMLDSYQYFWHNGRLFIWYRQRDTRGQVDYVSVRSVEARLYCFARTTTPIKEFIEEAANYQESRNAGMTKVYRPCSAKQRSYGDCHWRSNTTRPSRPLQTVILDKDKKRNLIADIQQYLLPATRKWYAQRGIPYRRGYLFHGSPGTGKTSLSFALAGLLDLDIYCMSLAEKSMTEDDLFELFEALPRQCLVLLEDIDTAGLQKRDDKAIGMQQDSDSDIVEVDGEKGEKKNITSSDGRISLSGLLNAIDGVASHEGRVLVMTTNDISGLDQALLRPGRIDVKLYFGKSTKQDAHDLFVQTFMNYDGDSIDDKQEIPASLKSLAEQFAAEVPDAKHTPAEIQGYLLAWKNNKPEDAVENVRAWLSGQVTDNLDLTMKEKS